MAKELFWCAFAGGFAGAVVAVFLFAGAFVYWDTRDDRAEKRRHVRWSGRSHV